MARGNFWRLFRIMLLLYVLLFFAAGAFLARARTTDWDDTLYVGVYPVNGDRSTVSANYIDALDERTFADVEAFFARELRRYDIQISDPVVIKVGEEVVQLPPAPPGSDNIAAIMWWSLRLRFWGWRQQLGQPGVQPDITLYMIYHDPESHPRLAHSLGLQKGLIGVVNAFASRREAGANNVVLAHELLHTVGASDKYDPGTNQPVHPYGFAAPARMPLYPQSHAEIMGGRIPLSAARSETPASLRQVVVGPLTAAEIRWIRPGE